ncbi:BrnT family toxin [Comamonas sp. NLF-1-9]|uniref:BrnT family toxin n=1 Tax=Comamonas sp. NLF-1-9 TaxID=2853163 RepID=UPI001C45AAE7|nr:BrnT family toxin [Comamonas sp. NLF-1-9]QXL83539.1 BrnT family toxin [Comamonas sp. NLF-1-9]
MRIEFDADKHAKTFAERGLDFADAQYVFDGVTATRPDERQDCGEPRLQTLGLLRGRAVAVVWTPRGDARRIISMRYCHDSEIQTFGLG